jgi:hypothetical protein
MLFGLVALGDHLEDELAEPGEQKQRAGHQREGIRLRPRRLTERWPVRTSSLGTVTVPVRGRLATGSRLGRGTRRNVPSADLFLMIRER